ncbi:MAG: M56 family metallopeptidase [Cyanobacteriota bacterium]
MTHLGMLLFGLGLSWLWRAQVRIDSQGTWSQRWQSAWVNFVLPPLFLVMTALALAWMGPWGQMAGTGGWFCYGCALALLVLAVGVALHWAWEYGRSCRRTRLQALTELELQEPKRSTAYVLDLEAPFAAQVGVWRSRLVVSRGLLQQLDQEHLQAVLAHEEAHRYYRDTLWMFGLGWLRRLTPWLPQTEALWQELLMLRELRADRWAAQRVDPLVLGEALLQVVGYGIVEPLTPGWVGFALEMQPNSGRRLQERIDALLQETREEPLPRLTIGGWAWLGLALLPLMAIPFHS